MIEVTITNEQQVVLTLNPNTSAGHAAAIQNPVWTVRSGDSTIVLADDSLSATLVSSDDPGTTDILISADADLGDGVETISDSISLVVTHAKAVNLGLSVGTPTAKPVKP